MVVANTSSGTLAVLLARRTLGLSPAHFAPPASVDNAAFYGIATGDLNADGATD